MKFTLDIPDEEIEKIVEKKLGGRQMGKATAHKEVMKKRKVHGPLLEAVAGAIDRVPKGSRRQGVRFKLGQDLVESSVEVGLKNKVEALLAEKDLTISKACHAFLVLLLEENA